MDELYLGEIGLYIIWAVGAIAWALVEACFSAGKTDFHLFLEDNAVITPMLVRRGPEVVPAIGKASDSFVWPIHTRKHIRDWISF